MKRKNAYLDQIGLSRDSYCGNFVKEHKLERFIERRKYGFDYRDVFNMDVAFMEWLYSHLKMYLAHTLDDLSFNSVEFGGKKYTIGEAINLIIEITKIWLLKVDDVNKALVEEEEYLQYEKDMRFAGGLFLEIMGYCSL